MDKPRSASEAVWMAYINDNNACSNELWDTLPVEFKFKWACIATAVQNFQDESCQDSPFEEQTELSRANEIIVWLTGQLYDRR